jgi:hypothetical protein
VPQITTESPMSRIFFAIPVRFNNNAEILPILARELVTNFDF